MHTLRFKVIYCFVDQLIIPSKCTILRYCSSLVLLIASGLIPVLDMDMCP